MFKRWTYTVFDESWTPTISRQLTPSIVYHVWGTDMCPTTNRRHIHGYIRFNVRKRMGTVKNLLGREDAHLEASEHSEGANRLYCLKSPQFGPQFEEGDYDPSMKQGSRSDLKEVATLAQQGVPLKTIAETFPTTFIRNHAGIKELIQITKPLPPLQRQITALVLWGTTGSGKTWRFRQTYPFAYTVGAPGRDPWGMYYGERQILFDEFNWRIWPIHQMNLYLDEWRCKLDARYQDKYAEWDVVGICANSNPASWYETEDQMTQDAFRRRIRGRVWYVTQTIQDGGPTLEDLMRLDPTPL